MLFFPLGTTDVLTQQAHAAGQDPAVELRYCNGFELCQNLPLSASVPVPSFALGALLHV